MALGLLPSLLERPGHPMSKLLGFGLTLGMVMFGVGCAAAEGSPSVSTQEGAQRDGLTLTTFEDGKLVGTYASATESVGFESVAQPNDVFEVTIKLHGLVLDGTIDVANHTSSLDGYAAANGGDTQLTEADRKVVEEFGKVIDARFGADAKGVGNVLSRITSMWSQQSPTVTLNRRVMGEEGRGWTSICGSVGQIYNATHDCWSYDDWNSNSSQYAYVGYATGSTYYWRNGWSTSSYDHASWPYEYGDCFGRCGADCGGSTQYTVDCHNHDGCVRNGHSIASLWCDDEFASASDDWAFAPNCGRN
jgi:hypothetical protein